MSVFNLKNLIIYRVSRDFRFSPENMATQLQPMAYSPCGSQDMAKTGWVSPMGNFSDSLIHSISGQLVLFMRREEKILPGIVIKQHLQSKIEKLEGEQNRKLKKTEKDSLRDEVLHTLLPRAFSRFTTTVMWIDTNSGLVIVDSNSFKRAEDALALLRKSLGSLPVVPLTMESPVELTLTEWVRSGSLPAGFALQDEAELKAILEEGGVIHCKKQDLISDEISSHVEAGKLVTKLALNWQERVQFVLTDDCTIKRVKFTDSILDQNDDIDREDYAQRFDADVILLTSELGGLIKNVINALGGESTK